MRNNRKEYRRAYYLKNRSKTLEKNKQWRIENKERMSELINNWRKEHLPYYAEKARRHRNRYPLKTKARGAVSSAILCGTIDRPNICSTCNKKCVPEAHHHKGYALEFHLDVIWVCKKCHLDLDAKQLPISA